MWQEPLKTFLYSQGVLALAYKPSTCLIATLKDLEYGEKTENHGK